MKLKHTTQPHTMPVSFAVQCIEHLAFYRILLIENVSRTKKNTMKTQLPLTFLLLISKIIEWLSYQYLG